MIDDDLLPEMVPAEPKPEPNVTIEVKDPDFPSDEEENEAQEEDRIITKVQFEDDEEIAPQPKKREIIPREEIFKTVPKIEKVKKEKKPRKKVEISEERRQQLREQMKKAQAAKKAKAQERKELRDLELKVKKKETEAKKKRLKKKLEEVEEEVDEETGETNPNFVYPKEPKTPRPSPNKKVVEDTIQQAVARGIEEFEIKRKAQKKEKKERIAKEQREKQVFRTVSKAIDPDAFWENCFRWFITILLYKNKYKN